MLRDSLATVGLASVVAASFGSEASEALNHAGLALGFAEIYVEALGSSREHLPPMGSAPRPGQFEYGRWNADGTYDRIIWPYGYSVVEDQLTPGGNRIPPNTRS
jgi:hypothetical protein